MALARHAAMPDVPTATFSSDNRMLNAVWSSDARSCLYCCNEQFVDTPTREKGPFLWDASNESEGVMRAYGDQNMSWQALRDVARGQARYWPDGQVNAVYPNGDGARAFATFTARYPEWLWRYYTVDGRPRHGDRPLPVRRPGRPTGCGAPARPAPACSTGWPTPATATRSTATTCRWRPTRPATCSPSTHSTGWRQLAAVVGDPAGAADLTGPGRPSWRRRSTPCCGGRTAPTSTASRPDGAQSGHASQEANALALAYGVVPADDLAAVGAYVASLGIDVGPNHGLELLRALAAAGLPEAMVHTLTDTSIPGWAHIVAGRRDLHLGGLEAERPHRGLHVPRLGLLRAGRHAGDPAGRVASWRPAPTARSAPPCARRRPGSTAPRGRCPTVAGPLQVSWQRRGAGMALA